MPETMAARARRRGKRRRGRLGVILRNRKGTVSNGDAGKKGWMQ